MKASLLAWACIGAACVAACDSTLRVAAVDLSKSTLDGPTLPVQANGHDSATLTVTLLQADGSPAPGWNVTLSADSNAAIITQPSGTSDVHGVIHGSVASRAQGSVTVLAAAFAGTQRTTLSAKATVQFLQSGISLTLHADPNHVAVGHAVTLTVQAQDANGSLIPTFTGNVTLLAPNAPQLSLPGPYRFTAQDAGRHIFQAAVVPQQSGTLLLTASDSTQQADLGSTTVQVAAGAPSGFSLTPQALVAQAGTPQVFEVSVVDGLGNLADGYSGTLRLTSSDGAAVLPAELPFAGDSSRAVTVVFGAVGVQNLRVLDPNNDGLLPAISQITVQPGAPHALSFLAAPNQGVTCTPLSTLQVAVHDVAGNVVSDANVLVLVDLGQARLGGTLQQPSQAGVATFADVQVREPAQAPWRATASGLVAAWGPSVQVREAPPVLVPSASSPTGRDCINVGYTVQQACQLPVDITVQWQNAAGAFVSARQAATASGNGTTQVPSDGRPLSFLWNSVADAPTAGDTQNTLRLFATAAGVRGPAALTQVLVQHSWTPNAPAPWVATADQPCVLAVDVNHDAQADLITCEGTTAVGVRLGDGSGTFAAPVLYPGAHGPVQLATGDVNLDGNPDVVWVNALNQSVQSLAGGQDGNFTAGGSFSLGAGPVSVAVGDFNHDGKLDYITYNISFTSGSYQIALTWALGNSTFGLSGAASTLVLGTHAGTNICQPGSCPAQRLVLADINRDGAVDAVTVDEVGGTLLIAWGNGTGFSAPTAFSTLALPQVVAVADVNRDGNPDVAVANLAGTVQLFLGLGNGALQPPASWVLGGPPVALAFGDLEGDGWPDMVLLGANGYVARQGYGGFMTTLASGGPPTGGAAQALLLSDVNHDALADVIIANAAAQNTWVLTSIPRPTCPSPAQAATAVSLPYQPGAAVAGDFNEDGRPDVWLNHADSNHATLLLGDGGGGLTVAADVPLSFVLGPPASGDLNRDGHLDVVAPVQNGNALWVAFGDGALHFSLAVLVPCAENPAQVALTDLNGDGALDAAVANNGPDGTVAVLLNDGQGHLGSPTLYGAGSATQALDAADVNGDGYMDVVAANHGSSTLSLLVGLGDGTFAATQSLDGGALPQAIVLADLNGDTWVDAATLGSDYEVSIHLGTGNSDVFTRAAYPLPAAPQALARVGLDLAVATGDGGVVLLRNDGDGAFYTTQPAAGPQASSLLAVDMDGDQVADMLASNAQGPALTLYLNGPGGPRQAQPASSTPLAGLRRLRLADLNLDGALDAVTVGAGNAVAVQWGDVGHTSLWPSAALMPAGTRPDDVVVGDINHDGWPDIVAQSASDSTFTLYLSTAANKFAPSITQPTCSTAPRLVLADFNRDGLFDVATACPSNASFVQIQPGRGNGTFGGSLVWNLGATSPTPRFTDLVAADFNNDGATDIALADAQGARVSFLFNDGQGNLSTVVQAPLAAVWSLAAGDLNADGFTDVVAGTDAGLAFSLGSASPAPFAAWSVQPLSPAVSCVVLADLTGQGELQAVAAQGTQASDVGVTVLAYDRVNEAFTASQTFVGGKTAAVQVAVGDVNGDQVADLVLVNDARLTSVIRAK